ncbi:hypothetical protein CLOSS21_00633 [Clostridium sp. SS2/1]|nr:hypothetical protein CLOSS21_00633 [Clostridium sp. SS2/1]
MNNSISHKFITFFIYNKSKIREVCKKGGIPQCGYYLQKMKDHYQER